MKRVVITLAILVGSWFCMGQSIYTAEGYWKESNQESYRALKSRQTKGDSLMVDEKAYLADFDRYLQNYFTRLPESEKQRYLQMKSQWDNKNQQPQQAVAEDFEWRNRDRFLNAVYGAFYGASLLQLTDARGGAAAGLPLVTAGLALLGPAVYPARYEGITQSTIRAANSGKLLGLGYGASLGLALAGDGENSSTVISSVASIGSLTLGELAFQAQKRYKTPDGKIEIMRHYGFLGPAVALSIYGATGEESSRLGGLSLLAGGVSGLFIGRHVYRNYDYSRGDVSAVNSLAMISAGLGFSLVISELENNNGSTGLILVPATAAVLGTIVAQRNVKGVYLTKKQGSALGLATSGAALVGFGVMAIVGAESPTAIVAVPSVMALIVHRALFSKYKHENLLGGARSRVGKKKKSEIALRVMPENYFVNRQMPAPRNFNPSLPVSNPMVNVTWKFK